MCIAEQIVDANVFTVGFGGGEPTLRKDLIAVINTLSQGGVDTHLTTNGWFLSAEYLEKIRAADLGMLLISIDSHDRQLNDDIRNSVGSFKKACEAVKLASSLGLNVQLASVASAENILELEKLVELAELLGADGINFKIFRPVGGALKEKARFELSESSKLDLAVELRRLKEESSITVSTYQDSNDDQCSCGVTQLTLRPNGDVSLCPYSSGVIGNLTEISLKDLWRSHKETVIARDAPSNCIGNHSSAYPYNPNIEVVELA